MVEQVKPTKKYLCSPCFKRLHHTHAAAFSPSDKSPIDKYLDRCPINIHEIAGPGQKCEFKLHGVDPNDPRMPV